MKHFILLATLLAAIPVPLAAQETAAALLLEDCRINAGRGYPGIKARCGTFHRPQDPADPASKTLELFVAVIPALTLEPAPDPFVPIAGGPGPQLRLGSAG